MTTTFENPHAHIACVAQCAMFECTMYSYDSKRASAYSNDLRWRMVWQREVLGMTNREVAANLGVDTTTVWRTVKLFKETGTVQPKTPPGAVKKLSSATEFTIASEVLNRPGIMLHELLHRIGFSRQKLRVVALQRSDFLRAQFVSDVSIYELEMLIFLDETGSDRRNSIRKYGYSL